MKKLITTIALAILMVTATNAQIKKLNTKLPNNNTIPNIDPNLNLDKIKSHLKSGDYCYDANLVTTTVIPPKSGNVRLVPIIGHFSTSKVKEKSTQLEINGVLLKNTSGYVGGELFTVFVTPNRNDSRKIDPLGVFITWRLVGEDLRTFQLKNVTVTYEPYGILILGDYDYEGILIGVSMTLTPKSCLI